MSASLLSLRSQVRGGTSAVGDCLRRQAASRRTLQRQLCVGGGGFSRTDRHARSGADLRRASSRQPPPSPRSRLFSAVASSSASAPGPTLFGDTIIVTKRCAEVCVCKSCRVVLKQSRDACAIFYLCHLVCWGV